MTTHFRLEITWQEQFKVLGAVKRERHRTSLTLCLCVLTFCAARQVLLCILSVTLADSIAFACAFLLPSPDGRPAVSEANQSISWIGVVRVAACFCQQQCSLSACFSYRFRTRWTRRWGELSQHPLISITFRPAVSLRSHGRVLI